MDYSIFDKDIVFVNNIKGTTTRGFASFYRQIVLLKIIGHLKFAYVKFEVIKITNHPEDDTVKVRWRIRGITGMKVFMKLWKFKLWSMKNVIQKENEYWHDGFSTFHVNAEGKVYKIVTDKMMPDTEHLDEVKKPTIPVKLALCVANVDLTLLHSIMDYKKRFFRFS